MPTKPKGMTSIEIAILVAIIVVIAVAAAWYLYTTFVASATGQGQIRIISAIGFPGNHTIRVEVVNTGSNPIRITHAEVFGIVTSVGWIRVDPGGRAVITFQVPPGASGWLMPGAMIQGRLISSDGHSFPFTVRII